MDLLDLTSIFYKKAKIRGNVDIRKLKNLESIPQVLGYLETSGLDWLGRGSSRSVYTLSSRFAIKAALNEAGIVQNKAELDFSNNTDFSGIVARVIDYHPQYLWLISDLVRPIKNESDFQTVSGIIYEDFKYYFLTPSDEKDNFVEVMFNNVIPFFILKVDNLIKQNILALGDAIKIDSWGKTPDGRIVLLDYGLTPEIFQSYYTEEGFVEPQTQKMQESIKTVNEV